MGGSVGIGTASPSAKLQVFGTSAAPSVSGTFQGSIFSIKGSSTVSLDMGTTGASGYYAWMQAHDAGNGVNYKLAINPLGGNVGIGTTSPTDKLDVAGALRLTSNITFDATKAGRIYKASNHGLALHSVTGTENDFAMFTPAGQLMLVNPTGTNNVVLIPTAAGNVGIGITNPDASLHVTTNSSSGTFRLSPQDGTYEDYRLDIVAQASNDGALTMKLKDNTFLKTYGYYNLTGVSHGVAGYEDLLHLKNSGNVGIGTTSPQQKLHVYKSNAPAGIEIQGGLTSITAVGDVHRLWY
jgi:hypothetical protein